VSSAASPLLDPRQRPLLWSIVAGGAVMSLALGIRHVQGLFLLPVTLDRSWSRETFSFAMALQNLVWGLAQPVAGALADRFGTHKVAAAGVGLYTLGLVLMVLGGHPLVFLLGAGVLIGVALACTAFGVVYGAITRIAPPELRATSVAVTGAVGGLGLFVLVPATQALQGALGWRGALAVLAAGMATLVLAVGGLRDQQRGSGAVAATGPSNAGSQLPTPALAQPQPQPQPPRQSMRQAIHEALGHRGFWLLNLGFLTCGFQLAFIGAHLPAYVLDKGLRAEHAVAGLAIVGLANVAGTYACGRLGGVFRRKHVLALLYLARTAATALFVLLPLSPLTLYLFCVAMGLMWLGTVPLTNGIVSGVFGVRYVSTLFGFVFLGHQLGGFAGAWLGGWVFDHTRSYDGVWMASMALGVLAAVLHLAIDDRPLVRPRMAGAAA
jgi:MFS family permease